MLAGFIWWRRRPQRLPEFVAPVVDRTVEKPVLKLDISALRLDRSLMNATVSYRIAVRNPSTRAVSGLNIEADLSSAAQGQSQQGQLASPHQPLPPCHTAERIAPGGSLRFEGQLRLSLSQAAIVRQGNIALLIPLMRVRATADGLDPVAKTLVIGQGSGERPQPLRLDEPPRSYAPPAQRLLDSAPDAA